jgi:endonuclease/exonuclease/phosphatase (EEP) superfamily protein YafD
MQRRNHFALLALISCLSFSQISNAYEVILEGRDSDVRRTLLAKKFSVPPLNKSHISFGQSEKEALNPNSIKVLVWNILKGERKKFEKDIKTHGADKDIFLLQEGYHTENNMRILSELEGVHWDFGVSFLWMKKGATPGGTMVGTRAEPSTYIMKRTHDLEPIIKTPKTLSMTKIPIEGRTDELLVISIHGMNFTNTQALESHMKLAEEEMVKHRGPVIFAGDFNTRNWDRFNTMVDMANRNQLNPVIFKDDKRIKPFGTYLDHSFVRGLTVVNARVLKEVKSSDHKAMVFEVKVP